MRILVLLLTILVSAPVSAAPSEHEAPAAEQALEEVLVTARRESPFTETIDGWSLTSNPSANLAEALAALPGISGVVRGGKNLDPVIRGQGGERVHTEIGCVPIYGACPARMDPPATYIQPHAVRAVEVSKGLGALDVGPGSVGGSIRVPVDFERGAGDPSRLTRSFDVAYDAARSGLRTESVIRGGTRALDGRLSGSWSRFRDYESPRGVEVPSDHEEAGASGALGWRPADGHRVWSAVDYTRGSGIDFPALPMDSKRTELLVVNTGYRWTTGGAGGRRLEIEAGVADVEHLMNNEDKPNRGMMRAETPSDARTWSTRVRLGLSPGPSSRIAFGAGASHLTRDAVRRREIVASGVVFHDHLWPDASQTRLDAFAQVERRLGERWTASAGGSVGTVRSRADAVSDPGLGGTAIEQHYVRFYGPGASEVDRDETTLGAQARVSWRPHREWRLHVGGQLATRPAGITERYFAFGPAPGGFQVGDPSLEMEEKWGAEGGIDWSAGWIDVGVSAYHHRVENHILPTTVLFRDVNGDGRTDRVRGFRNVTARFRGGEVAFVARPMDAVRVPVSLAYVDGRNLSQDRALPEIPPLEGSAAVRTLWGSERQIVVEVGTRFAAAQDDVDPEFGEDETPAWATLRAEAAWSVRGLRLKAGVENILDTEYHEHLTREALLPVGDLTAGAEIPSPGRSVYAVVAGEI